jgi:short subunit dehydrogenase-like uncharacterized protein
MADDRAHDIVVFGATGFTGALTAEYLARNAPPATRWALAGRNRAKLEALRERLGATAPSTAELPLLVADVEDPASLQEVAASTRVVITTVGPYIRYGEPLVEACAQAGTDYVDLTGEPEFVDLCYLHHQARAVESGARLVHCCGFDSIPHDLGALFTVQQLPEDVPLRVEGFVRAGGMPAGGMPSGGTFHSAITAMSRVRETATVHKQRAAVDRPPPGRRVRLIRGRPHRESAVDAWAVPLPTIDPQIVRRSARALDRYGPDFAYGHYAAVKHLAAAAAAAGGLAGLLVLAQVPPARDALLRLRQPGEGPSEDQRAKGWFKVRFVGEGGGRRVVTEVAGGDPGYSETAKMLSEAALCLAHDDLPQSAGQVTTAVVMGDSLRARLQRAGISFTVLANGG